MSSFDDVRYDGNVIQCQMGQHFHDRIQEHELVFEQLASDTIMHPWCMMLIIIPLWDLPPSCIDKGEWITPPCILLFWRENLAYDCYYLLSYAMKLDKIILYLPRLLSPKAREKRNLKLLWMSNGLQHHCCWFISSICLLKHSHCGTC